MISKRVFGEYAYGPEPKKLEMIFLVLNYVACLPVILAVGLFSLYHLWALVTNTTTIEGWEKQEASELRRKGRIHQFTYPFSLGPFANIQSVLGRNPLLWWFPQKMVGDGLKYPTAPLLDPWEQYLWPPRDLFSRRAAQIRSKSFDLEPFTYGNDQLNPTLIPTKSKGSRLNWNEGIHHRNSSPYHPDYQTDEESDSGRLANGHVVEFSESDEEPLSTLIARQVGVSHAHHPPITRRPLVRRGSEGLEVTTPSWSANQYESDGLHAGADWQDEGSEGSDGWD